MFVLFDVILLCLVYGIEITNFKLLPCFSLVCNVCAVRHGLFSLSLGVISRLFSITVAIPGRLFYYFLFQFTDNR